MKDTTIVIRSTCSQDKAKGIHAAIDSCLDGSLRCKNVLVVASGRRQDTGVIDSLVHRASVMVTHAAKFEHAIGRAVAIVDTPNLGFLDDDDRWLPGAIDSLADALDAAPDADVVVGNGWRVLAHGDRSHVIADVAAVRANPVFSLLDTEWLHGAGALFRRDSFAPSFFESLPRAHEWTWIAHKVITTRSVIFSDVMSYVVDRTGASTDHTNEMTLSSEKLYPRILAMHADPGVRTLINRRYANALHSISELYLAKGMLKPAIAYHLRSMRLGGGLRFLPYTRHLAVGALRKLARGDAR